MEGLLTKKTDCRGCRQHDLTMVLSLGQMPAANAFLREEDLDAPEPVFPLELYFCNVCALAQLIDVVSPEYLFRNYVYVSSTSPVFVSHFEELADSVIAGLGLRESALVVDIGSNDGILLRPFKILGMRVLGIDPARKIAAEALRMGIETIPEFFDVSVAREIRKHYGPADLVTATNVFAHIDDLDAIVEGVKLLLGPDGAFMVEAAYLGDFLEKNLFDTIYHEHLCYYSALSLVRLLERRGMVLFDVEHVSSHGGSLRAFFQLPQGSRPVLPNVQGFFERERAIGLDKKETFFQFAKTVEQNRRELLELLKRFKQEQKKIIGYGAPAKGNTLLNYFGIGAATLDYIVDDSSWKQGLYTPGSHIPIRSFEALAADMPDYILILAWNFAEPIMEKLRPFGESGVRFIIPVPQPTVF